MAGITGAPAASGRQEKKSYPIAKGIIKRGFDMLWREKGSGYRIWDAANVG